MPHARPARETIREANPAASETSPCDALGASEAPQQSVRRFASEQSEPCDGLGASEAPQQSIRRIAVRRIVIDHRERRSGVPEALARHPGVAITYHHLSLGDYRVDDTLVVERKTLTDFARSVRNGRLFAQASRLVRSKLARSCLIVEGARIDHWSAALPRSALQGAIISVTLVFGLPLLRSRSPAETAALILYAADQLHRRATRPPRRDGYRPKDLSCRQSLLLQAIPGIGPGKAGLLLDAFGSPVGVASATIEDLRAIDGIGQNTAVSIHRLFHGE
jgi:ERCC4-type nuclease